MRDKGYGWVGNWVDAEMELFVLVVSMDADGC